MECITACAWVELVPVSESVYGLYPETLSGAKHGLLSESVSEHAFGLMPELVPGFPPY